MRSVLIQGNFDAWRDAARELLALRVLPDQVTWQTYEDPQPCLALDGAPPSLEAGGTTPKVPRSFVAAARAAACHREVDWALLYRVLWRIVAGERRLLDDHADPDVFPLRRQAHAVRSDAHRAKGFVRFRPVSQDGKALHVAWYEPDHRILRLIAPFFRRRFGEAPWSILTPDESVLWDGERLRYGPAPEKRQKVRPDDVEHLWLRYYAATYNPARVACHGSMKAHMPQRFRNQLPEGKLIPALLRGPKMEQ